MNSELKRSKIKQRIAIYKTAVASFFILTILIIGLSVAVIKTLRTFSNGESIWARSQITAHYYLSLYLSTRDITYYESFLESLEPIDAKEAGLNEIFKNNKVTLSAIDHFVAGKNDRRDLQIALRVLVFLNNMKFVEDRVAEWTMANALVRDLKVVANKVHQDYQSNRSYSEEEFRAVLKEINDINYQLSYHEVNFSEPLLEFSRTLENYLSLLQLGIFLCFSLLTVYIDYSTVQIFKRSLAAIKKSINDAVSGNLNTHIHLPAEEDIDGISTNLNLMYQSFREELNGRLSAEESQARLSILADTMPQIVSTYDADEQMEYLNIVGKNYFGVNDSNIKSFSILDHCHPTEREFLAEEIRKGVIEKRAIEKELRLKNTNGEYNWFLCRFQPHFDEGNNIIRWYTSYTNIQTQKNHSIELEKSIQVRDQFLSIASHELKTPLTALNLQIGMRQRLIDKNIVQSIELDYFQKIVNDDKKQLNRIIRLVDDMLDISRIRSGKLSFHYSEQEFNEFISEVLARFSQEFSERNCELIFHQIPKTICYWDFNRIEQVLINILSNALKYGGNKDVVVKLEKASDTIKIHVEDEGDGISLKDQKKIFELFERANRDRSISGLGLGLYISNQIVQSHQGTIEVSSRPLKGSVFTVSLPIRVLE